MYEFSCLWKFKITVCYNDALNIPMELYFDKSYCLFIQFCDFTVLSNVSILWLWSAVWVRSPPLITMPIRWLPWAVLFSAFIGSHKSRHKYFLKVFFSLCNLRKWKRVVLLEIINTEIRGTVHTPEKIYLRHIFVSACMSSIQKRCRDFRWRIRDDFKLLITSNLIFKLPDETTQSLE